MTSPSIATGRHLATLAAVVRPFDMRLTSFAAVAAFTLLSVACVDETHGAPRGWGPLALGTEQGCADVAGRYLATSEPISVLLASNHLPNAAPPSEWAWFELSGEADTALTVTVTSEDGVEQSGQLRRGSASDGDYFCEDGWLQIADRRISNQFDDETESATYRPQLRSMRVAKAADGALVARFDFITYSEITVWCGDGCKGLPVPGTFKTHSVWSAAERWDADGSPTDATSRVDERSGRAADRRRAQRDRLLLEEQRLENGPDTPMNP